MANSTDSTLRSLSAAIDTLRATRHTTAQDLQDQEGFCALTAFMSASYIYPETKEIVAGVGSIDDEEEALDFLDKYSRYHVRNSIEWLREFSTRSTYVGARGLGVACAVAAESLQELLTKLDARRLAADEANKAAEEQEVDDEASTDEVHVTITGGTAVEDFIYGHDGIVPPAANSILDPSASPAPVLLGIHEIARDLHDTAPLVSPQPTSGTQPAHTDPNSVPLDGVSYGTISGRFKSGGEPNEANTPKTDDNFIQADYDVHQNPKTAGLITRNDLLED